MGLKIRIHGTVFLIGVIFMGVKRGPLNVTKSTFRTDMCNEALGELSES
jgi:hypothetical protein